MPGVEKKLGFCLSDERKGFIFIASLSDSLSSPCGGGGRRRKRRKLTKLLFPGKPMHVSAAFRGRGEKGGEGESILTPSLLK